MHKVLAVIYLILSLVVVNMRIAGLPYIGNYHVVTAEPEPLLVVLIHARGSRTSEWQCPAAGAAIYCTQLV